MKIETMVKQNKIFSADNFGLHNLNIIKSIEILLTPLVLVHSPYAFMGVTAHFFKTRVLNRWDARKVRKLVNSVNKLDHHIENFYRGKKD